MDPIIDQIKETLEKIRPFLQKDGGDLEFVEYKDGIVKVKMSGACQDCMFIDETISNGVEQLLQEEVPGVIKVEVVKEETNNPDIEMVFTDEEENKEEQK